MNFIILVLFTLFSSVYLFGQTGTVRYTADPRIESLVRQQGIPASPNGLPQVAGYRVQLMFDSEKKIIDDARMSVVSAFPKVDTYVFFNAPQFVLKVGDFRTLLEAERVRDELLKDFPASFIVKEMINLPRIDQE